MYYRSGRRNKKFIQIRNDDKDDHLLIRCVFYYMEIWKDIKGYEGLYQVSNKGNVRSLDRIVKHPINKFLKIKGKLRCKSKDSDGYLIIGLCKNGKNKTYKYHRLVAFHFIPNPENKPEVNHIDGDKTNNNDWNLEWNTNQENITHSIDTGLANRTGLNNGRCKLTEKEVLEIRKIGNSISMREISRIYKIHDSTVKSILIRRIWKHI